MNDDAYWRRVNDTVRYGTVLAQTGLITHEESVSYTFGLLDRLLSIKLIEEAKEGRLTAIGRLSS